MLLRILSISGFREWTVGLWASIITTLWALGTKSGMRSAMIGTTLKKKWVMALGIEFRIFEEVLLVPRPIFSKTTTKGLLMLLSDGSLSVLKSIMPAVWMSAGLIAVNGILCQVPTMKLTRFFLPITIRIYGLEGHSGSRSATRN